MILLLKRLAAALRHGERGAAASEYAISLAFIAAAIALAVSQFNLTEVFPAVVRKIASLID